MAQFQDSKEFLEKFFGKSGVSFYVVDGEGKILWGDHEESFPIEKLPVECGSYCYRVVKKGDGKNFLISKIGDSSGNDVDMGDLDERVYAVTVVPLENGKFGVLKQDITFFKKIQENLFYKYNLSVITNLAAGIAHEVNNPLTVIQGLIEFYLKTGEDFSREDLEKILKMCNRIKSSISHFMGYFDSTFFEKMECSISQSIENAISLYRNYAKCENVVVEFIKGKDIDIKIERNLLINAILNILNNLGEILRENRGERIEISFYKNGNVVNILFEIDIEKSGDKVEDFIFPYSNFNCKTENMGCGFLIAYWAVKKMGGEFKVFKKVNKLNVNITFPIF